METHRIYCSACDKDVTIEIESPDDSEESDNTLMNAVCLEMGEHCTGTFCPICAVPPVQSAAPEDGVAQEK